MPGLFEKPMHAVRLAFGALFLMQIVTLSLLWAVYSDLRQTRSFAIDAASSASLAAENAADAAQRAARAASKAEEASCFAERAGRSEVIAMLARLDCRPLIPTPQPQPRAPF